MIAYKTMNSDQPLTVPIAHRHYELQQNFVTHLLCEDGLEIRIDVPEGFINDGATIPRWLWWFLRPDGIHRAACLIHDYLYDNGGELKKENFSSRRLCDDSWKRTNEFISKEEADQFFRTMLIDYGVAKWRAYIAWVAVTNLGRGKYTL